MWGPLQSRVHADAALDWLCLHLPTDQLPKRFAAAPRAGVGGDVQVRPSALTCSLGRAATRHNDSRHLFVPPQVRVLGTAGQQQQEGASGAWSDEGEQEGGQEDDREGDSDDAEGEEDAVSEGGQADDAHEEEEEKEEEDERAAAKAWIRQQYLQQQQDDEGNEQEEEGADRSDATSSAGSSIDDWEVWADPREVERRRQVRT